MRVRCHTNPPLTSTHVTQKLVYWVFFTMWHIKIILGSKTRLWYHLLEYVVPIHQPWTIYSTLDLLCDRSNRSHNFSSWTYKIQKSSLIKEDCPYLFSRGSLLCNLNTRLECNFFFISIALVYCHPKKHRGINTSHCSHICSNVF